MLTGKANYGNPVPSIAKKVFLSKGCTTDCYEGQETKERMKIRVL